MNILIIALTLIVQPGMWDSFYFDFAVPPEVLETDMVLIMVGKEILGAFTVPYNNDIRHVRSKEHPEWASGPVSGVWNNIPIRADMFPEEGTYVYTALNFRTGEEWEILRINQYNTGVPIMPPKAPTRLVKYD
jgi:hypothetical protein